MKNSLKFMCLVPFMMMLTSCICYTNGGFSKTDTGIESSISGKKVYLEEVILSDNAGTWVYLDKQRKEGTTYINTDEAARFVANKDDCKAIANYIASQYPAMFSTNKENAIPIRLKIDAQMLETKGSSVMASLCGLTFFIIPLSIDEFQSYTLVAETVEQIPKKANHVCSMETSTKMGGIYSPIVWIGLGSATGSEYGMSGLATLSWRNYYLTPEFASNAAAAVSKLVK